MPIHLLQIAKKLAHDAGQLALQIQERGFKVETKGNHTNMVTEADKACEQLIIKTIKQNFPDHEILGEESGKTAGKGRFKWIIDPIDGTTNFAHGMPIFGISIAVIEDGNPIIGIVEIPSLRETFWAQKGKGAFLNEQQIHVSKTHKVADALLATGFPYNRTGKRYEMAEKLFKEFYQPCHGVRRLGAASIDLCFVAAGRYDGFWEYDLKPWDIAAGKIIIEEAGGLVTNMDGSKLDPKKEAILATNGLLHQEMLATIKLLGGDKV
jgi:myo-inositol-1(or 4)-monophosphatase